MMIVRGVNVFPTQIEDQILKIATLAAHYQIVLTREGRLDEMDVQVEARSADDFSSARDRGGAELAQAIKHHIGVSARVTIMQPAQIERSVGKAKRVIDKRPKT
jgi:phenylacetate-CoA ligase